MKIGIIVHSDTGHTLSVAEKLKEKLSLLNHDVNIERVIATDDKQFDMNLISLESNPNVNNYELLIFAAPVRGFNISPIIKKYLSGISSLDNKEIFLFVTKTIPSKMFGGNTAISKMKNLCVEKNGNIIDSEIIYWNKTRDSRIEEMIERFSKEI